MIVMSKSKTKKYISLDIKKLHITYYILHITYLYIDNVRMIVCLCVSIWSYLVACFIQSITVPGLTGNSECCQDATAPHHQIHRSVSRSDQLSGT